MASHDENVSPLHKNRVYMKLVSFARRIKYEKSIVHCVEASNRTVSGP